MTNRGAVAVGVQAPAYPCQDGRGYAATLCMDLSTTTQQLRATRRPPVCTRICPQGLGHFSLPMGTGDAFADQDDLRHHVYSLSHPYAFELKLYRGEKGNEHRFEHTGVVVPGRPIHDGRPGYVPVVDNPGFDAGDGGGAVTISGVPYGGYQLQQWHPDPGMNSLCKSVTLAKGNVSVRLSLDVCHPATKKRKEARPLPSLFRQ